MNRLLPKLVAWLPPVVTRSELLCYLFVAFVCGGMFTYAFAAGYSHGAQAAIAAKSR